MTCHGVQLPGGGSAIVCMPKQRARKCSSCKGNADLLCDWKIPGKKSGTCDKPICARCSTKPMPDKDLCKAHAAEFETWKANR